MSSLWVPRSTTLPRSRTMISLASRMVDRRWATIRQVQPRRRERAEHRHPEQRHAHQRLDPRPAGMPDVAHQHLRRREQHHARDQHRQHRALHGAHRARGGQECAAQAHGAAAARASARVGSASAASASASCPSRFSFDYGRIEYLLGLYQSNFHIDLIIHLHPLNSILKHQKILLNHLIFLHKVQLIHQVKSYSLYIMLLLKQQQKSLHPFDKTIDKTLDFFHFFVLS